MLSEETAVFGPWVEGSMKIGIDARLIHQTGVGRYIRNLLGELARQDTRNSYVIFLGRDAFETFPLPNDRWKKRIVDIHWHTIAEQVVMPFLLLRERLDLVHIPYFTIPIFYPGKFVVTIHDLIILHHWTGKATTRSAIFYWFRRVGYRIALEIGLRRAAHIFAVSETTKQEILDHFAVSQDKISVTYEGVDDQIQKSPSDRLVTRKGKSQNLGNMIDQPYFLYVGNAYPHKNLEFLMRAFREFLSQQNETKNVRLVLVGSDDFFYRRLFEFIKEQKMLKYVTLFGPARDEQLVSLYRNAIALVFPSHMEGFGLPALEALSLGCPVICSDIPVFHEILADNATYFDPQQVQSLSSALQLVAEKHSHLSIDERRRLLIKYNWKEMAQNTLASYEHCARL